MSFDNRFTTETTFRSKCNFASKSNPKSLQDSCVKKLFHLYDQKRIHCDLELKNLRILNIKGQRSDNQPMKQSFEVEIG